MVEGRTEIQCLHRWTKAALETRHAERVFVTVLENGTLVALNYNDKPEHIELPGQFATTLVPFSVWSTKLQ